MKKILNPHEYIFKFDMKQGFHHIDIYIPNQQFLGFSWEVGRRGGDLLFCI